MTRKPKPLPPRWVTYEVSELIRSYLSGLREFEREAKRLLEAEPSLKSNHGLLRQRNEYLYQIETQKRFLDAALAVTGPVSYDGQTYGGKSPFPEGTEVKDAAGLFVEIRAPYDGTARLKFRGG